MLVAFTEGIWAFSLGSVLHDLNCPRTTTDLYSYFAQDLYQVWYDSDGRGRTYVTLFSEVTNSVANRGFITMDAVARPGLVNSPRAATAAHAWIITNSMHGSYELEMIQRARELWEARCGSFVVATN